MLGKTVQKLYGSLRTKVKFQSRKYERKITKKLISKIDA